MIQNLLVSGAVAMYDTVLDNEQVAVICYKDKNVIVRQSLKRYLKENEEFYGTTFQINKGLLKELVGNIQMRPLMILGEIWVPLASPKKDDYILVSVDHFLKTDVRKMDYTVLEFLGGIKVKVNIRPKIAVTRLAIGSFIKGSLQIRKSLQRLEANGERHILKEDGVPYYICKEG